MSKNYKAHLALLGANLFYGAGFTVAKMVMPRLLQPTAFIFIRVSIVTALFWCTYTAGDGFRARIAGKDFYVLVLGGLFGIALNQLLFFIGLNKTLPIHASLIMMSTPLLISIWAAVLLKERLKANKIAGLLLGICGAVLLMISGNAKTQTGASSLGDFFIFLNAASYAVYLVIIKPLMLRYRPLVVLRWVFLFGFIFVIPFSIRDFLLVDWALFTPGDILAVGFVVVCCTFFTYLWNVYALRHLSPSVAGAYIYLQPVFAATISILVIGESLTWTKLLSAALIFSGVYLVNFGFGKIAVKHKQ